MISKKKFLITCVNFNSNSKLLEFIESLNHSFLDYSKVHTLLLLVGDNSDVVDFVIPNNICFDIKLIKNGGNFGYIGGINKALELSNISPYFFDYFTISNVDVTVSSSFFLKLIELKISDKIGWIAPSILSEDEGRDRNPKTLRRPSYNKMKMSVLIFRFPILFNLYFFIIYKFKKNELQKNNKDGIIYAGYGSFMIFTKHFLTNKPSFEFPSFLFGEEIFFGELIRASGLKVLYEPTILVYDSDHVSTSKISSKVKNKFKYDSAKVITKMFFKKDK